MENEFVNVALTEAQKAKKRGEVPIGACVVKDGKVISRAHNMREKKQNAICHAEIIAISKACKKLHSWRLDGCDLYVTLEPCPMCAGAIANARISRVFFMAPEKTSGDNLCASILGSNRLNHKVKLEKLEEFERESAQLLSEFFKERRK